MVCPNCDGRHVQHTPKADVWFCFSCCAEFERAIAKPERWIVWGAPNAWCAGEPFIVEETHEWAGRTLYKGYFTLPDKLESRWRVVNRTLQTQRQTVYPADLFVSGV